MLKEAIENFRPPVYVRTKRSPETYRATETYVQKKLISLVEEYKSTRNDEQTARLIRDDIDNSLRRYHEYCIKQNFGGHYIEVGAEETDFEHMIPASTVRDMLIAGIITPKQACNVPTCKLSKDKHVKLGESGWGSKTPDSFNFWKRYQYCFETQDVFTTWDGHKVDTSMTLEDHFNLFC
jgi:hypothetical protein